MDITKVIPKARKRTKTNNFKSILEQFLEKYDLSIKFSPEQLSEHNKEIGASLQDWEAYKRKDKFTIEKRAEYCAKTGNKWDIHHHSINLGPKNNDKREVIAVIDQNHSSDSTPTEQEVIPNTEKLAWLLEADKQNAEVYKKRVKRLERNVKSLETELKDLDECVDRPKGAVHKDFSYSSESSEDSESAEIIEVREKKAVPHKQRRRARPKKVKCDQPKALRLKHLTTLTNIPPKSTSSESSSSKSSSFETSSSESSSSSKSSSSETSSSESSSSESSSSETSSESSSSDSDIGEIYLSQQELKNSHSINNIWKREVNLEWTKRKEFLFGRIVQGLSHENKTKVLMDGLQVLTLDDIVERLSPEHRDISQSEVSQFAKEWIQITWISICDIIHSCTRLQHLDFSYCGVTNEIIKEIGSSCLNLKYLKLEGCDIVSKEAIDQLVSFNPNIHVENFVCTIIPAYFDTYPGIYKLSRRLRMSVDVLRDIMSVHNYVRQALGSENFVRRSLVNKLEIKYTKYKEKNRLECLDLSFQYKGKDRLVSINGDNIFNDFVVIEKPKVDLVLGLPWLWLREAKIDIEK
ncbi:hypothetical protein C1646_766160 [Rhizophagus diaphanus]|nr:hypothetical protein C1646_766160 [Rhizophagus diaphanus] [Rhizophagus sp. MUCL 43196]